MLDLAFIGYAMHQALLVSPAACHVEPWAGYLGTALIFSYLVLFIRFFAKTYLTVGEKAGKPKAKTAVSSSMQLKEE